MLEIIIRHLFNIENWIVLLIFVNSFFLSKKLRFINLSIVFLLIVISFVEVQNKIINYYSDLEQYNTKNIDPMNEYDIIIMGSNSSNRIKVALEISENFIIQNILFIKDNYKDQEFFEKNRKKFPNQRVIISKISSSTYEDYLIVKDLYKKLNNNLIIITDDFHISRTYKLFKMIDKNIFFYPLHNTITAHGYYKFNLSRGLNIVTAIIHEIIADYLYSFKGYYN